MSDMFIRGDVLWKAVKKIKDALREIPYEHRWYVVSIAISELDEEEAEERYRELMRRV